MILLGVIPVELYSCSILLKGVVISTNVPLTIRAIGTI